MCTCACAGCNPGRWEFLRHCNGAWCWPRSLMICLLLGWFFLTTWDGRVTRVDFLSKEACEQARAWVDGRLASGRTSPCFRDGL